AGEGGAQREGEELGLDGVDPGAVRRRLILSDGHPRPAEARVPHAIHGPEREGADDKDEEVPGDEVGIEVHEGQVRPAHRIDAVLASREVEPLHRLPPADVDGDVAHVAYGYGDDLAVGQSEESEAVAAPAQVTRPERPADET